MDTFKLNLNPVVRKVINTLVVIEILLYDWGFFELGYFRPIVNLLKILIPFFLFAIAGLTTGFVLNRSLKLYIIFFILFCMYVVVPTLFSNNFNESFVQYIKIIPSRLFFIIAIACLFSKDSRLMVSINKYLFYIGIFTFIQFFFAIYYVNIHPFEDTSNISDRGGAFAGPFGIYGNVVTQFILPTFQAVRLTGFWIEPSNASGFLISVYFIGLGIREDEKIKKSNFIFIIPLLAGLLTLSSAGYISFAISFSIYHYLNRKKNKKTYITLIITFSILILGIFGRFIYIKYLINHLQKEIVF